MGFSIVVFEGSLVQAGLAGRGPNEKPLFYKLTQVIDIFLILFVALRFAEIVINDKSEYLSQWNRYALMFWSEIALMIFPLLVFHWDKSRRDSRMLFLGALSMLLGAALWRLDYSCSPSTPAMATTTSLRGGSADLLGLRRHRGVCLFAADPAAAGTAIT
jgi:Ni/Fe-hydrogenase subunit HybB-like protein